jgi:hypothetical protein
MEQLTARDIANMIVQSEFVQESIIKTMAIKIGSEDPERAAKLDEYYQARCEMLAAALECLIQDPSPKDILDLLKSYDPSNDLNQTMRETIWTAIDKDILKLEWDYRFSIKPESEDLQEIIQKTGWNPRLPYADSQFIEEASNDRDMGEDIKRTG